jgi:RNA polymerase sigma-70 factor (ECF subfamily)
MDYLVSSDTHRGKGGIVREAVDRKYVDRLRNRDPETEAHFTRYFGDLLRIKLRARLRSAQLIDDLRQETFLRVLTALRKSDGIEHPERLGAFVNAVCDNLLYSFTVRNPAPQSASRSTSMFRTARPD